MKPHHHTFIPSLAKLPAFRFFSKLSSSFTPCINNMMYLCAKAPGLTRAMVMLAMCFLCQSQAHAATNTFESSGLKSGIAIIEFIIMLVAGAFAIAQVVIGSSKLSRGEEGWMHIIGAAVCAMATALVYYLYSANGLSNAAISTSDINNAGQ